jgi:hypothetical protein
MKSRSRGIQRFRPDRGKSFLTVKYRSICAHRSFQRKRPKIKQIGWYLSVYLVQSVHAPRTHGFQKS